MHIGIGIDTGGTYTDAVIYDFIQQKILASSKSLTTKEDLSIGITKALDQLPLALLTQAELVALSTTLATNACIENKGGRAKLVFIGNYESIVRERGKSFGLSDLEDVYFLPSKGNIEGEIQIPPNWEVYQIQSKEWFRDADAVAIVETYAMKNNAILEKEAKALTLQQYGLPTICGHELSSDLGFIQRGASALLNARLIPIIESFLDAIKKSLAQRGIQAPIVIVRSDASLMSEQFATHYPVETLLCGPAASAMGGYELSGVPNSLIVDMGGTTTDIALIKKDLPVLAPHGIAVGQWKTFVKGLFIDTFGLGGDSAIRYDKCWQLYLATERIMPLCILAHDYPEVTSQLETLLETKPEHSLWLHEFFVLVQPNYDPSRYSEAEQTLCAHLMQGPLILSEAAALLGCDSYSLNFKRLESEGIIIRSGLTPTDIMHLKGDFDRYNTEASRLGAQFVSNSLNLDVETLCDQVYSQIKKKLYTHIARILLEDQYPDFKKDGIGKHLEQLISDRWENIQRGETDSFFALNLTTSATLVGIGAPTHIFLPDVAKALNTTCIIPDYAPVANALGAIVGNIRSTCEIQIKCIELSTFMVYGTECNTSFDDESLAIAAALVDATQAAKADALSKGASSELTVHTEVIKNIGRIHHNHEILIDIKVIATATGKISPFGLSPS